MTELHIPNFSQHDLNREISLDRRLDAFARGECTAADFLHDTLEASDSFAHSPWDLLAFVDQRYRRGELSSSLFRAIQSEIGRRAIDDRFDGVTIEMFPASTPANADLCLPAAPGAPAAAPAVCAPDPAADTAAAGPPAGPPAGSPSQPGSVAAPADTPTPLEPTSTAMTSGSRVASEESTVVPPQPAPHAAVVGPALTTIGVGFMLRGRYLLESVLGRGGMGDVYKASDGLDMLAADADRQVAVKVLRARISQRPELLANLRREFECTRKLSHPNIVKVYELDRDGDFAFYTMELLDGERLSDVIERSAGRGLPRSYAWTIIGAVGAALAHAHSRSVIHGDVSPKNIVVTHSGEVRVLDFGSSRMSDGAHSPAQDEGATGIIAVTPEYASCELLEGRQPDPRDDLFALACLAYELLAGSHPFAGRRANEARLLGRPLRRPSGLSFTEWRALQRALSWSREGRYLSIDEWLLRLGVEPEPQRTLSGRPASRASTAWSRSMLPVSLLAVAGLFGGALAWQAVRGTAERSPAAATPVSVPRPDVAPAVDPPPGPSTTGNDPSKAIENTVPPTAALESSAAAPAMQRASAAVVRNHDLPTPARPQRLATVAAATARDRAAVIAFTAHPYAVHRGQNFAEVHLWRSRPEETPSDFLWWTEDLSARAGADFHPQARTPHSFAPGRRFTTLFIRLIPNAVRTEKAAFQVCIGRKGRNADGLEVSCSTVALPATAGSPPLVRRG